VVATYGALFSLLDALYQYPGGWAADRFGRRRSLILFTLAAAVGYTCYLGTHWAWVIAGTFLVMAWDTLTLPSLFATVGDNLPREKRAAGFGWQSVVRRIPTMIAPPLGGLLIAALGLTAGVRVGLVVTIAGCLLAVVLLALFYRKDPSRPHEPIRIVGVWRSFDARLKRLLVADILARWAEGIPKVFVVIYCTQNLGLSALLFGWLMTVQRLTNLVAYLPAIGLGDRPNRKPFVLATFAIFALFPLVLANAAGFWGAVVAFVVAGLSEVGEPARKALIVDLAPQGMWGRATWGTRQPPLTAPGFGTPRPRGRARCSSWPASHSNCRTPGRPRGPAAG